MCPYYISMGMTYEQFWFGEPEIAKFYREANLFNRKRTNEELWLLGIYIRDSLMSTVGNMFSKEKYQYPSEPKPITELEIKERKEREERERIESIKARFTARALSMNAHKGEKK